MKYDTICNLLDTAFDKRVSELEKKWIDELESGTL